MFADMVSNKILNLVVTELFTKGRKLNISLGFIRQSYFAVPTNIRLNSIGYLIMNKQFQFQTIKSFSKSHLIIH